MEWYGITDKGLKRASNQDAFAVELIGDYLLAVVCDGMGGAAGGNIASELACEYYTERFSDSIHSVDDPSFLTDEVLERFMSNSVSKANYEVHREAERQSELRGMGTTLVSCLVKDGHALIANVGDSRLYHVSSSEVKQITKDHSFVQTLVDAGAITPAQAANHPNKNIITRVVGVDRDVECDIYKEDLSSGYLLLCSDGLSNYMEDEPILHIINSPLGLKEKCDKLVAFAYNCGAADNITAILIRLGKENGK